jgi:hypothetical protein
MITPMAGAAISGAAICSAASEGGGEFLDGVGGLVADVNVAPSVQCIMYPRLRPVFLTVPLVCRQNGADS